MFCAQGVGNLVDDALIILATYESTSQEPAHEHEGFFERILHRHHDIQEAKDKNESRQATDGKDTQDHDEQHKKESERHKMKDYLHEDEELEDEGRTYGGLM
ncbi:uncharacterized protein N7482_007729 [Penicillium canariense]|uniref:Uncharacterized protein n=1 Tax=Penicillium canariense TaxID=189055 RepID=A0A9W9I034_9EURO|nr:uncharacterized protein N7482_007729 [Penicillium canariense]KAJ5160725.1 hypothetical protein N7482_007729 [Penicillium canariense]